MVGVLGFAAVAQADISPEQFWNGPAAGDAIGHRHTLSEVSARNVNGIGNICVTGLNDDNSWAGGTFNCTGGGPGSLGAQPLNGSSWRRGLAMPTGATNYRAQENF
jgi:hypothetical protein